MPDSFALETPMARRALISPCGRYRYWLSRRWGQGGYVNWIMLNPSTGDAQVDDATIRRCIGFTKDWGYDALWITNLFAFRSADPKALASQEDPVGLVENSVERIRAAADAALVVVAWGAHKGIDPHVQTVLRMLYVLGKQPHHLGLTASGQPKHPLYLPSSAKPTPWEPIW